MNTSPVNSHIDALSKALKDTKQFDAKTREALTSLQKEIDQLLNPEADASLADRLEQLAVRFENNHPAVGTALRQAIDALAKAGM